MFFLDHAPTGTQFGDCLTEPEDAMPGDTVTAVFVSGHLRSDNSNVVLFSNVVVNREKLPCTTGLLYFFLEHIGIGEVKLWHE